MSSAPAARPDAPPADAPRGFVARFRRDGFCSPAWNSARWSPGARAAWTVGLAALGLAAALASCLGNDLQPLELARALAVLGLGTLPPGYLLTRRLARDLWRRPVERVGLALLLGWPALAAAHYLLALAGADAALPALAALVALVAGGVAWRARGRDLPRRERFGLADAALVALAGLALLATLRDYRALRPGPAGLVYDQTLEHAIHAALFWELLRGVPPAQLPTAAGVTFPHYHVLGYLPGTLVARHSGLGVVTLSHAFVPAWHLVLLVLALHLAVTARTGRAATSLAALVALFFAVNAVDSAFLDDSFAQRVPLEFLTRTVSGGAGIVLWVTVAALLAAWARLRPSPGEGPAGGSDAPLFLAAGLAGLSYGVKAQMLLLVGGGLGLALLLVALAGRRRPALLALLVMACCTAPFALTWRTGAALGTLRLAPGLFAREASFRVTALGEPWAWLAGTPLALWSLLHFSPLFPAFAARSLAGVRRTSLHDLFLAGTLVSSLVLGLGLAVTEIQSGAVSALFVREAFYAVQVGAVAVDVGLLAHLAGRFGRGALDGPRAALLGTCAAAVGLLPVLLSSPTHRGPREPIVLSPGETGALLYLRQFAPADAVVAQARSLSRAWLEPPAARGLDRVPLVAALAGRRAVLEYYRPDIDPSVDRLKQLRSLYSTHDPLKGEAILRRFRVDYVLEEPGLPLRFRSPRLTAVYAGEGVRLLRFEDDTAPARPRPAPLPAPEGLR